MTTVDESTAEIDLLRERLALLEDVVRCLPAGLIVIDANERIAMCNPLADEIRGVGRRVGGPVDECHPGRSRHALTKVLDRFRSGDPDLQHPIVLERANRWQVSYSRVTGSDGEYRGIAWLAHDISKQKQLQQQLLHQERISGLGRMAAKLAHEVKNPLNIIAGAVHNLKRLRDDADSREMIAIIDEQLARMGGLIDHLREATRPLKPQPRPTNVGRLVRDVIRAVPESRLVEVAVTGEACEATVDPELLQRLITNAVCNAAAAAGPAGKVDVKVSLETQPNGEWLQLEFIDDGPGFTQEVLDHLFQPFVTTRPDGTGLGLVIMREVCLLHGGDLTVSNRETGGARVTARLLTR